MPGSTYVTRYMCGARYSMKENTVKSVLFRTREQLRAFLQKEGIAV